MIGESGKIVWRVRAPDEAPRPRAFDALVLPVDGGGTSRSARPTRLLALAVPHESELPDTPLTLIVRAREDATPLVVECEAVDADGTRRVYGRAGEPLAVFVRTADGLIVAGLPGPPH